MNNDTSILLIGEGGIPSDFPKNELSKFLNLKSKIDANLELSSEEITLYEDLNNKIKKWKRNFRNDEYFHSLIDLQTLIFLKSKIKTSIAFLNYCEPDIYQAIGSLIDKGFKKIILICCNLILNKEYELKLNDFLNFIKIKYKGVSIINFIYLDFDPISNFFISLIKEALNDK